ncbi:hypothetical protein B0H14DRAFT_1379609 [Mycena olivaceomarginata]|nr:hypothetical protein B0H14DRAFT_1379609 [Mycena olivaceomarginata]
MPQQTLSRERMQILARWPQRSATGLLRNRPTSPPQSDSTVIAPTTTPTTRKRRRTKTLTKRKWRRTKARAQMGATWARLRRKDELEELNPSAIQRCRTRGVRVDYTSPEALQKAGLTTEYDADSEDEDAMIEGGCADSEDEDFRMWED